MAVGQENGRAVLAHDGAGRAGRVVGNVVFREILIVNGKRAARQEGEILAEAEMSRICSLIGSVPSTVPSYPTVRAV